MIVYAIVNQKGGTGKTTTAINLAAALGEAGERVVVLDLDPQANATLHAGLQIEEGEPTVWSAIQADLHAEDLPDAVARRWDGARDGGPQGTGAGRLCAAGGQGPVRHCAGQPRPGPGRRRPAAGL